MALDLPLFPTLAGVSYPVKKAPLWSTKRHQSTNGRVTTFGRFIYPMYRYELVYEFLRGGIINQVDAPDDEYQQLLAFFNSQHGGAEMFLFHDPDDDHIPPDVPVIFGTGDGVLTKFQLVRPIVNVEYSWSDPVFSPSTWFIYIGGVLQVEGTDYTITTSGLVTFATAPAAAASLTWYGTYLWPCLFDEDSQDFEKFMQNLYELKSIKFTTQKVSSTPID